MKIEMLNSMIGIGEKYVRCLLEKAKTIRDIHFLKELCHNAIYSEQQYRLMFVGFGLENGEPVSVVTAKAQHKRKGIWGRYCTLTYAYTHWDDRHQGHAKAISRQIIDITKADRIKALAATRLGLFLHRSLGHNFWGLNEENKCIIDSKLESDLSDLPGVPIQIAKVSKGQISFEDMHDQFKKVHEIDYMYRDNPEEYLLNGASDLSQGFIQCTPQQLLKIRAYPFNNEWLRWGNRNGCIIKRPSEKDLNSLFCFFDTKTLLPAGFAGDIKGKLNYQVIVSKRNHEVGNI